MLDNMQNKKYRISIRETISARHWHSYLYVDDINDLLNQLNEKGLVSFDIECFTPYDEAPNCLVDDLLVDNMTEKHFEMLTKASQYKLFITPRISTPKTKK